MQQQIKQNDIDNAVQVQSTYMLSVFSSHVKTIAVCGWVCVVCRENSSQLLFLGAWGKFLLSYFAST